MEKKNRKRKNSQFPSISTVLSSYLCFRQHILEQIIHHQVEILCPNDISVQKIKSSLVMFNNSFCSLTLDLDRHFYQYHSCPAGNPYQCYSLGFFCAFDPGEFKYNNNQTRLLTLIRKKKKKELCRNLQGELDYKWKNIL